MPLSKLTLSEELLEIYTNQFKNIRFSEKNESAYEAVYYFLSSKGKKIRPLLVLLSTKLFDGKLEDALNSAFAVELFHNFTLIHDDIMDQAEIRRGQPTVHKHFNEETALLAGDLLLILAYQYLGKAPVFKLSHLFPLFINTAKKVLEGQHMDSVFESMDEIKEQEYLQMIELKTAVLLASSLRIGAILANASELNQNKIYEFGRLLGISFQIKDDWLDVFGQKEKFGKKIGGDIVKNKKTYLYVKAYQLANKEQRKNLTLLKSCKNREDKISKTIALYKELSLDKYAEKLMDYNYRKAMKILDEINIDAHRKEPLFSFAKNLYNRDY
ncbi:polyprenyl synthetase family protein [Xanthovirga aplysinae]|uniref:polyprenyl synthetase family protein n=1 Tax=Xanthovirga aplysinae TaxID=2529853 RepID=UPI0012BC3021|nr:polyprenyl synthetase family protein [Xanthovirga aplysinae]MTI31604.1 polyprenyl synthetase family protein [Xanthovirga aplysinae]